MVSFLCFIRFIVVIPKTIAFNRILGLRVCDGTFVEQQL
jgi:hypothetical protein